MNERLERFIGLLKEIFELDKSDLDFGIYRVMNLRKAQIEQFLTKNLPEIVQQTLEPFDQGPDHAFAFLGRFLLSKGGKKRKFQL